MSDVSEALAISQHELTAWTVFARFIRFDRPPAIARPILLDSLDQLRLVMKPFDLRDRYLAWCRQQDRYRPAAHRLLDDTYVATTVEGAVEFEVVTASDIVFQVVGAAAIAGGATEFEELHQRLFVTMPVGEETLVFHEDLAIGFSEICAAAGRMAYVLHVRESAANTLDDDDAAELDSMMNGAAQLLTDAATVKQAAIRDIFDTIPVPARRDDVYQWPAQRDFDKSLRHWPRPIWQGFTSFQHLAGGPAPHPSASLGL